MAVEVAPWVAPLIELESQVSDKVIGGKTPKMKIQVIAVVVNEGKEEERRRKKKKEEERRKTVFRPKAIK